MSGALRVDTRDFSTGSHQLKVKVDFAKAKGK